MNVRFRTRALADIGEIYNRLSGHSGDMAGKIEAAIFAATDLLGDRPYIGAMTDFANVRRWPMPDFRYTVFYRISTHDYVDVLRVIDGRLVKNLKRPPR